MTTYSFQQMTPYMDVPTYLNQLGGDVNVLSRIAAAFSVNELVPPAMAVVVQAGAALRDGTVVEIAARTTPIITAPSSNSRIDRVVLNPQTDALLMVQGVEAASPMPPQIPAGYLPLAKIALTPATMAITNAAITDERVPAASTGAAAGGGLINVQTFTSSGTYTPTPGTKKIVVRVVGGGGSGGSSAATSSSQGSAASGGGAGAYAEALLISGFAGVTVSIGAGAVPAAIGNNAGNLGGTLSFGTIVTAPGGTPGYGSPALSPPFLFGGTGNSAAPTGGNIVSAPGQTGEQSVALSPNALVGGIGGASVFGAGGRGAGWGDGFAGQGPGAGGGGASGIASQTGYRGGVGAAGIVIVTEFG